MTQKDAFMLVFDVLEAEYDEYDVVNKAVSSGFATHHGCYKHTHAGIRL